MNSPMKPCGVRLKNELKPWQKKQWCIPPQANNAFVAQMDNVLDVYQEPYDPRYPVVCRHETNKHLNFTIRLYMEVGSPWPRLNYAR